MSRKRIRWKVLALLPAVSLSVSAGWAHHSFAMFDKNKVVTVQGLVSKVEWSNPHVYLFLKVKDARGVETQYAIECGGVNDLVRHGWKVNTLKVGDRVTLAMYPLRDGKPGGLLDSVTLANGVTIKE